MCMHTQCTHQIRHNNVSWCNLRIVELKIPKAAVYCNVHVLVYDCAPWRRRKKNSILLSEQIIEYFLLLSWFLFFSSAKCARAHFPKSKPQHANMHSCNTGIMNGVYMYTMLTNVVRVSTAIDIVCFRHWVQKRQFKINMETTQTVR